MISSLSFVQLIQCCHNYHTTKIFFSQKPRLLSSQAKNSFYSYVLPLRDRPLISHVDYRSRYMLQLHFLNLFLTESGSNSRTGRRLGLWRLYRTIFSKTVVSLYCTLFFNALPACSNYQYVNYRSASSMLGDLCLLSAFWFFAIREPEALSRWSASNLVASPPTSLVVGQIHSGSDWTLYGLQPFWKAVALQCLIKPDPRPFSCLNGVLS